MRSILAASAAALVLAGCGADPDYYLLPPPAEGTRLASNLSTVAVAEIGLPTYAEAVEIAVLAEDGSVRLNPDALWADTPRRALTRHLVASLQQALAAEIASEPWPGFEQPAVRVEVIVDRLVGALGGSVTFSGQFLLIPPESGEIAVSSRFNIVTPVRGEGYSALLAAHARSVETLAGEIARRIAGLAPGTA